MRIHLARRVSEAIGSWLHLEFLCLRAGLLSENSLKAAVGMVLSSQPPSNDGARVHADFPHAALNPRKEAAGRKRSVDFAQLLISDKVQAAPADVLLETKWAGSSHCTQDKIFEDFLRLAILKRAEPNADCVFVLAGNHTHVSKALSNLPFETHERRNRGIGATGGLKRFEFSRDSPVHKTAFETVIRDYYGKGFSVPASFVTRAYGLHPQQSHLGSIRFQCIAWEIESVSPTSLPVNFWS